MRLRARVASRRPRWRWRACSEAGFCGGCDARSLHVRQELRSVTISICISATGREENKRVDHLCGRAACSVDVGDGARCPECACATRLVKERLLQVAVGAVLEYGGAQLDPAAACAPAAATLPRAVARLSFLLPGVEGRVARRHARTRTSPRRASSVGCSTARCTRQARRRSTEHCTARTARGCLRDLPRRPRCHPFSSCAG